MGWRPAYRDGGQRLEGHQRREGGQLSEDGKRRGDGQRRAGSQRMEGDKRREGGHSREGVRVGKAAFPNLTAFTRQFSYRVDSSTIIPSTKDHVDNHLLNKYTLLDQLRSYIYDI